MSSFFIGSNARVVTVAEETEPATSRKWLALLRYTGPTCGGFALASLAYSVSQPRHTTNTVNIRTKEVAPIGKSSLEGLALKDLGPTPVREIEKLPRPLILVIGEHTCQPCIEAHFWSTTLPGISSAFVSATPGASPKANQPAYEVLPEHMGDYASPTLILVGLDGKVLDSNVGWSRDETFQTLITKRFVEKVHSTKEYPKRTKSTS